MLASIIFGILASVLAIITYIFYFYETKKGATYPNPSTWLIWLLAGLINTLTYFLVVKGNIYQSLIAITVTLCQFTVFFYALTKRKFSKITKIEVFVFTFAVIIGIYWQITDNFRVANLALQLIYLISIIPTVSGLLSGRGKEHYLPWLIVIFAYISATLSVATNFQGDWLALAFPVVNGIIVNGVTLAAILYTNHKRNL